ncbi:MAG: type pilus assembly protein PilP [Pseudomonadota bacterium]|nr:type pilus assembly protein PilP [Pseudomonadota bacterium]
MSRNTAIFLLTAIVLAACSGGEQDELRQWMKEETKDFRGKISPLPQVKPYEPVAYDAAGLVDPFRPAKMLVDNKQASGGGLQPDMNRPREPLESYPLESIKYVGSLTKNRQTHGIVQVDGNLHQVRAGSYMGQNFGVITKISESEMNLRELVQDPAGDWVERTSTLLLQAKEGK